MKTCIRYKYHILAAFVLLALLLAGVRTKTVKISNSAAELPNVENFPQHAQAFELSLRIPGSLALNSMTAADEREFIFSAIEQSLPADQHGNTYEIARAVITEANHHGLDPLFLLAVITTESQFNIHARGTHGEIGLMQILPQTAQWLAPQAGLPKGFDLEDPSVNIRIGATYISSLRHSFKRKGKRYIAAYNMGSTNVRRLLKQNTEPTIYPMRVIANYERIHLAMSTAAITLPARGLASIQISQNPDL